MGNLTGYQNRKLIRVGGLAIAAILGVFALTQIEWATLLQPLDRAFFALDGRYHRWINQHDLGSPKTILPLAFGGGLIASISPCVLGLLPVNLSYIGTREVTSRWDAFVKAGLFVLGVVTTYSALGLSSSLAGIVLVFYRGYIHVAVGVLILLMGLTLSGILQLPLPQLKTSIPVAGPYGVGLTFALVSSPCSSPVMFSILAIAAERGSLLYSTLTMISYALGYTMIIFLASLFTGFIKQTRRLLPHSAAITRISSAILILVGGYYLADGLHWIFAAIA